MDLTVEDNLPNVATKFNLVRGRARCAICGAFTQALRGPDLFLADTDDLVCWTCGLKLAPELMQMLGAYWKGRARRSGTVTRSA